MADRRKFIERFFEVVHERIDQAEEIGLQKLDQIERQGRREVERALGRHEKRLRELDRDSKREAKRRKARRWRDERAEHGLFARPAPPAPPARPAPSAPSARPAPPAPPAPAAPPVPPSHAMPGFRADSPQLPGREYGHRHRHRRRHAQESPEDRAYAKAKRRANRRLAFYTHATAYAGTLALLLLATRSLRVVLIVGAAWGFALFMHHFWTLTAPRLRERWIEREVGARAPRDVSRERVRTEGRHTQNMEDLSASIAHEIRNPIAAAKSLVQQMGEDPAAEDNIEFASVALQELDRVERSISHLLRYAREEDLEFGSIEMADVVRSAVETFRDRLQRTGVDLQLQIDTPGRMRGDAEKLRRVLINLLGNALDALAEGPTRSPVLQVMLGDNLAGDEVWVRVRDNGPGIDEATRDKIWSPFYTTKETGTGLGLALSRKIVDAHGGDMELASPPGEGSEFVLTFPKDARRSGRGREPEDAR